MTIRRNNAIHWATVLTGSVAFVLSFILCIHALSGRGLIGCTAGTSCNEVLGSRWSFLFGLIPVSALAAILYIILLVCIFFRDSLSDDTALQRATDVATLLGAGAILGSAIWFIWLQKNMIRAFCPYCMSAHTFGIIFAVLIFIRSTVLISGRWCRILILFCGLLAAALLAGTQLLTTPRTAYDRGFVPEGLPQFDPHMYPCYGNPDADTVVTLLYDYRCSHCQKLHAMLPQVAEALGDGYAIVTCTVPLSSACNPYVRTEKDRFAGSCELTRYALAVWNTDKESFYKYDSWLFEEQPGKGWYPRETEEAREMAASLIGEDRLAETVKAPWQGEYLTKVLELFGRTSSDGKSAVPRFICGGSWMVPDVDDVDGLATLLRDLAE